MISFHINYLVLLHALVASFLDIARLLGSEPNRNSTLNVRFHFVYTMVLINCLSPDNWNDNQLYIYSFGYLQRKTFLLLEIDRSIKKLTKYRSVNNVGIWKAHFNWMFVILQQFNSRRNGFVGKDNISRFMKNNL